MVTLRSSVSCGHVQGLVSQGVGDCNQLVRQEIEIRQEWDTRVAVVMSDGDEGSNSYSCGSIVVDGLKVCLGKY